MSGEWQLLFQEMKESYQVLQHEGRKIRMAITPEEIPELLRVLENSEITKRWQALRFGLADLDRLLPKYKDQALIVVEEDDNWMWVEKHHEIQSLNGEIYNLLKPQIDAWMSVNDHSALARLCGDHSESAVEVFRRSLANLLGPNPTYSAGAARCFSIPSLPIQPTSRGYEKPSLWCQTPSFQPSLDAWLRVHADNEPFALYFRDLKRERS